MRVRTYEKGLDSDKSIFGMTGHLFIYQCILCNSLFFMFASYIMIYEFDIERVRMVIFSR